MACRRVEAAERQPPQTTWTLATVALFRPRKGTEVLLSALQQLRRQGHDVRLLAVGGFETSEYETYLKNLTGEYDLASCVQWLGFQTGVNRWLQQSDLFVLPSLFGEGMPMVVLEAMALGVPVVGTDVEGVPEVVRDGVDGPHCQCRRRRVFGDCHLQSDHWAA